MYVRRGSFLFSATRRLNIDPPSSYRRLDQFAIRVGNAEVVTPVVVHLQLTVQRVPLVDSLVVPVPPPPAWLSQSATGIDQLQRQGREVSFSTVAQSAGVSRAWLYRQDQIRDLISRQRALEPPAAQVTAQRASTSSLRQRLDAARAEITRLRAENRSLHDQLARQLGLHRTQHAKDTPGEPA